MASERLIPIGFVSYLLIAALFLLAAWAQYMLLQLADRDLALLLVLLNAGGVAVSCIALHLEFAALLFASSADYSKVFQADQRQALTRCM